MSSNAFACTELFEVLAGLEDVRTFCLDPANAERVADIMETSRRCKELAQRLGIGSRDALDSPGPMDTDEMA